MAGDWIMLHRKLLESEVFQDSSPALLKVFLWCLLKANFKPTQWRGQPLAAGQFITGRLKGSEENGMPPSSFRNNLQRLVDMGCISVSGDSKSTTVTICNWGTYQNDRSDEGQTKDRRRTDEGQTKDTEEERNKAIRQEGNKPSRGAENFADEDQPPRLPAVVYYSAGQAAMVPIPDSLNTAAFREFWLNTWIPHRTAKDGGREPTTFELIEQLTDLSAGTVEQALARMRKSIKCGWRMLAEPETTKANGKPLGSIPADLFRKIR